MPPKKAAAPPPPAPAPPNLATVAFSLPLVYNIFFLFLEPVSALTGAYYAHFQQRTYLALTDAASLPLGPSLPRGTSIALSQLANLYALFALNEALVLRATRDLRVWKTVLLVLLLADLGHLYTVHSLGWPVYWDYKGWNAIDWGNVPFVYLGACMRLAFLADVGMGRTGRKLVKRRKE